MCAQFGTKRGAHKRPGVCVQFMRAHGKNENDMDSGVAWLAAGTLKKSRLGRRCMSACRLVDHVAPTSRVKVSLRSAKRVSRNLFEVNIDTPAR